MARAITFNNFIDVARALPGDRASIMGAKFPCDNDWREVTRFEPATDGRPAILDVMRAPAMFWRVRSGDIAITTGSGDGVGELAYRIAEAIAGGMLGFEGLTEGVRRTSGEGEGS